MNDELIAIINYETPPGADEVGALLTALARDYKSFTRGRVLTVISIQRGSIIATLTDWANATLPYLKDAVEIAKGGKALADFGKTLKEGLEARKSDQSHVLSPRRPRKTKVDRSVNAVLKIAAVHGRAIRIKQTCKNGETIEVEMGAPEAIEIQQPQLMKPKTKLLRGGFDAHRILPPSTQLALPQAIGRLYGPAAAKVTESEAESIIEALVNVLGNAGLGHMLPQIAADFASKGLYTLATALEAKMRQSGRDTEPPQTTT
jgi:hypothetical protein